VVDLLITKGLQLSVRVKFFLISKYWTKLQAKTWLPHALCVLANTLLKGEESVRDNHVLACNFAKYLPILIFFHSQTQRQTFLNLAINNPTTP